MTQQDADHALCCLTIWSLFSLFFNVLSKCYRNHRRSPEASSFYFQSTFILNFLFPCFWAQVRFHAFHGVFISVPLKPCGNGLSACFASEDTFRNAARLRFCFSACWLFFILFFLCLTYFFLSEYSMCLMIHKIWRYSATSPETDKATSSAAMSSSPRRR